MNRTSNKLLVLGAVCLSALAIPLCFTGPAVAMGAIGRQLGGGPLAMNWISNAFMLTFGSSLMLAGTLADRFGRKRIFLLGTGGFALFSLALAQAPGIVAFNCLRGGQGFAGALALASSMAALAQEFDGPGRARAFSLVGTTFGIGLAFGPLLCGYLVEHHGWPTLFYAAGLAGLGAVLLGAARMHESRDPQAQRLDWPGLLSFTGALSLLTCGILLAPQYSWASLPTLGALLAASVLLAAFIQIEGRVARPMLDLSLFRYPAFTGVQFLAAAPAYSFVVLLVLLPERLIGIEGMRELEAGWAMLSLSAPLLALPFIAASVSQRIAPARLAAGGLLATAAGLAWLSACAPGQPGAMHWPMLLIGTGISLPWGLMDGMAVSVVPKERAGMAAGIFSTTRVAGEGVALAIVAALLATLTQHSLSAQAGLAPEQAMQAAQHLAVGKLDSALQLLGQGREQAPPLVQAYGAAFRSLLHILAAITVATAGVIWYFMGRGAAASAAAADPVA
ncbi:MFS transporter [Massilia sp. NR 4-1]|uniref:MFS transporter n=1 Tax=Massilia sp. NR 4-1 TaxID=1678028 RepID=UPI00067CC190|nr:MFS transporter [Massilia sp. NR 4-1]AKU22261.1 MFS transporter [Massilia sp. NR 4-1]